MKLTLTAILILTSTVLSARNWQPSTLYFHNGDSLKGEVDFVDWKISPSVIEFRNNSQVRSYSAADLKSFMITGGNQWYELVRARLRYYNAATIQQGGNPVDHEDSVAVYAEVVYRNRNIVLYSLQDTQEDERLFIMTDDKVRELIHFTVTFNRGGQNYNQENNSYREQLKVLLKDCEVVVPSNLAYSSRQIIMVLKKYASCRGYGAGIEKVETPGLVNIGVFTGVAGYNLKLEDESGKDNFFGVDLQLLSKRKHSQNFIWVEAGVMPGKVGKIFDPYFTSYAFGLYGGRYLGRGRVQPVAFTGLSSLNGVFDTGAGIALDKRFILQGSFSLFSTVLGAIAHNQGVFYSFKLKVYPRFKAKS